MLDEAIRELKERTSCFNIFAQMNVLKYSFSLD